MFGEANDRGRGIDLEGAVARKHGAVLIDDLEDDAMDTVRSNLKWCGIGDEHVSVECVEDGHRYRAVVEKKPDCGEADVPSVGTPRAIDDDVKAEDTRPMLVWG